jgi:7-cyano-7-deazaguanine synthase
VPARNIIFLSYALALAETIEAGHIFIGTNSLDYSGYPDCRPEFIAAFEKMAGVGTRAGVSGHPIAIIAPLQHMSKAEIIRKGLDLGVDFSLTVSCYQPTIDGKACGLCESCRLRLRGFQQAGMADPISYVQ